MQTVDAALVQFVTQQKRLPCPADGQLPSSDSNAGIEGAHDATGCTTNQQHGVVPWRALGLAEADILDGWDRRLTYRTFPALAATSGMDMAWCDPAGTGAAVVVAGSNMCKSDGSCNSQSSAGLANCTPPSAVLGGKGLKVTKVDGITTVMDPAAAPHTGAAYVVISHGESGGGGYLSSGQLGASTVGDGAQEIARNYASVPYAGAATYYIDDSINENPPPDHFDDLVSRPSLLSVITKAGLGPRSH
jgi:hypothetical protein